MIKGVTKGVKSTEFWVSLVGMLGGIVCTLFATAASNKIEAFALKSSVNS